MDIRRSIPAFRATSFRPDRAWKSGATFMKLGRAPATSMTFISRTDPQGLVLPMKQIFHRWLCD